MQTLIVNINYLIGINSIIVLVVLFAAGGCGLSEKQIDDKSILLSLNDEHRRAHLEGNANLFVAQIWDTLTMVQDGEITKATKEEIFEMFDQYFKTVVYNQWDDIQPPQLEISGDATLATLTTQKIIGVKDRNSADSIQYETSQCAWTTTYRKIENQWKLISISSGYSDPE